MIFDRMQSSVLEELKKWLYYLSLQSHKIGSSHAKRFIFSHLMGNMLNFLESLIRFINCKKNSWLFPWLGPGWHVRVILQTCYEHKKIS